MNSIYSGICEHARLERIDKNFVRCLSCGESMISQKTMLNNKSQKDFVNENKKFATNANRNFSNVIEEVANNPDESILEYYTDFHGVNKVVVDRMTKFSRYPLIFEVFVNGKKSYMTDSEISKLLTSIKAVRIK